MRYKEKKNHLISKILLIVVVVFLAGVACCDFTPMTETVEVAIPYAGN